MRARGSRPASVRSLAPSTDRRLRAATSDVPAAPPAIPASGFWFGSIVRALIAETFRSTLVVALDENANPARRERQQARHLVDAVATRKQPQRRASCRIEMGATSMTLTLADANRVIAGAIDGRRRRKLRPCPGYRRSQPTWHRPSAEMPPNGRQHRTWRLPPTPSCNDAPALRREGAM